MRRRALLACLAATPALELMMTDDAAAAPDLDNELYMDIKGGRRRLPAHLLIFLLLGRPCAHVYKN